jgi:large subunit ribosomal protein L10
MCEAKTFFMKGGEINLAVSKKRKEELVAEYQNWLENSQAVILTEYIGLSMNEMDDLREKVREAGGEFHVVKNTLGKLAFEKAGYAIQPDYFEGSTAAGFAFRDPPGVAKTIMNFAKTAEVLKIKGGYLDVQLMSSKQVVALAELPPLPVVRAQLLGTLLAPAGQLARMLAEPARQVASVLRSYSETEPAGATG